MTTSGAFPEYNDLSTGAGFQFELFCGRCDRSYQSHFLPLQHDRPREGQHGDALRVALLVMNLSIRRCAGCHEWRCCDVCFDAGAGVCKDCAAAGRIDPESQDELARAAAQSEWFRTNPLPARVSESSGDVMCPWCFGSYAPGTALCEDCGIRLDRVSGPR